MKIYHICESFDDSYGGPARSVPLLADLSVDKGFEVLFLSTDDTAAKNEIIERKKNNWQKLSYQGPKKLRVSLRLTFNLFCAAISKEDKIFHVHNAWNFVPFIVFLIAKLTNVNYVVSTRGAYAQWCLGEGALRKKVAGFVFQSAMLNQALSVHVTSAAEESDIKLYAPAARTVLVSNPIPKLMANPALAKMQVDVDTACRFLFLSRVHSKKGIDKLLEAWCDLSPVQNRTLTIAGNFSDNYSREKFYETIDGRADIEYVGYADTPKKVELFQAADFFILPTESENFGIVIGEAMSMGLPALITKNTPFTESIRSGAGIIIEHNSTEEIKRTIKHAMQLGKSEYTSMSNHAINEANKLVDNVGDLPWCELYGGV